MKELGSFEIYSGGGQGFISFDNRDLMSTNKFSTRYQRYFIQSNIGWSNDIFEIAFSMRYVHLHYFDINTSEYIFDPMVDDDNLSLVDSQPQHFFESAATFRFGNKYAKTFLQVQRVSKLNQSIIRHRSEVYNFGISVNINALFD